jgi:hypothetical protein
MKASILTGGGNLAVKEEIDVRSFWKNLFQKLEEFFEGSFDSDWEKKRSLSLKVSFFG